ncbi:B-cell receptor CD22-like isoform X2 [Conger conger]|uniref:B-cell receptor CD22-like isoform X2 n=1 Tax=Conger conger TaxID=82655 RepID=UPI002A5A3892|nr:B-cell receptor CD22-like isoform X2 [Conger conger]
MNTETILGSLAVTIFLLPGVLSDGWSVQHPAGPIYAVPGSAVIIPCLYGYPDPGQRYRVRSVMWCRNQAYCVTPRYVYHSEGIFPELAYQGRVEYLGDEANNCTLKINDLRVSDSGMYVFRFITDHPVEKLPGQAGVLLLVTDSTSQVSVSVSPSGEIVEGSSVTLTCSSDANPPVQNYTWFKKNETGVWQAGSGQSLNFSNFRSWNSGQYYCASQNKHGAQNSTAVTVNIKAGDRTALVLTVVGIAVALALLAVIVLMGKKRRAQAERERGAETVVLSLRA